jgi:hypothetical protein
MYLQTMAEKEERKYKYLKNTLKITLCVEKQGNPLPLELFLSKVTCMVHLLYFFSSDLQQVVATIFSTSINV